MKISFSISALAAVALLGLACVQPVLAQPAPGDDAVRLSGSVHSEGQYSDRQGTDQQTPRNYGRLMLDPTLFLYDVPFSLHALLSSEQSPTRQNINGFNVTFNLNTQKLQDLLRSRVTSSLQSIAERDDIQQLKAVMDVAEDPKRLRDSLKESAPEQYADLEKLEKLEELSNLKVGDLAEHLGDLKELNLISETEKFIFNFPTLGIGVNYPNYSPMLLSGVPVTGLDFEFNPGLFYMAATGGKAQSAIKLIDSNYVAFKRTLYAGKLGFGRKSGGHVYLSALYAKDDDASVTFDTTSATTITTPPQANYVVGIEANVPLAEQYLTVGGELLGSLLTGDIRSPGIANSDIPDFVTNLVDPKISSAVDFSYSGNATVNVPEIGTRLRGTIKRVGAGFRSLGSPYLRTDLMQIEGRLEQNLLRRQIGLSAYLRREHDNLINWKGTTTYLTSYGISLGLNFRNLPFLRLSYVPYLQTNDRSDSLKVDNSTTSFNATAGYGTRISNIYSLTTATFGASHTSTAFGFFDYGTNTFAISEGVTLEIPLSLSAGFTLVNPTTSSDSLRVTAFDLSGSYTAYEDWQNSLGLTISNQGVIGNKLGFFIATYFPVSNFGNLEIRAEKNVYKDKTFIVQPGTTFDPNYNEVVLRASFTSTW